MYQIKKIENELKEQVVQCIQENWGSAQMVSRGKVHNMDQLPGFVVTDEDNIKGLITYHIEDDGCEIVSLDSFEENRGIGTQLVQEVENVARQTGCKRIWLITTNDNIRAIRFYQKRGYDLKALYRFAVNQAREIKPSIPFYGNDQIPILHELEFEKLL